VPSVLWLAHWCKYTGHTPEEERNALAQFLTFQGRVVAEQYGDGPTVYVQYRGEKEFVPVPGPEWKAHKLFVRYDSSKMDRQTAYRIFEADQFNPKKKEHTNAFEHRDPGKPVPVRATQN